MTELPRILLPASVAIGALCLLVVVYMVGGDRAAKQSGKTRRFRSFTASFVLGVCLIVLASLLSGVALDAHRRGGFISPTIRSGWMTPEQGYAAAILLLLAGIYAIVLSVRSVKQRREDATRRT